MHKRTWNKSIANKVGGQVRRVSSASSKIIHSTDTGRSYQHNITISIYYYKYNLQLYKTRQDKKNYVSDAG